MSVSILDNETPILILALECLIEEAEGFSQEPSYLETARLLHKRLAIALVDGYEV